MTNYARNSEIVTCVRMVGQLLLHHPTTGTEARNKDGHIVSPYSYVADSFCAVGAARICSTTMNYSWQSVENACEIAAGREIWGDDWDAASPKTRKRWATKLANFEG